MLKKKVSIQVISSGILQDDVIMLGEKLIKQWKIPAGFPLQLAFGSFIQTVTVTSVPKYDGIRMSHVLARNMGIVSNSVLRLVYKPSEKTIYLGPLISVLISRDYPDMPEKPFGSITMFCKELVIACQKQGAYVYFFTPEHVETTTNRVNGWIYNGSNGSWQQLTMPIANVVNNRLTSRKLENKPSVQDFLREVKLSHGTYIFNEKFLDKNEVFDALKQDPAVRRYLPESYLLRNFNVLKLMCEKYPVVFLKPVTGSLGKGIIRISRQIDSGYETLSTTINGTRRQQYLNLPKLFAGMKGKMKTTRYQIQQGLNLIDIGSRPVDFRALVQKNKFGKWQVTSIVARIANSNHFVSNLARGGSLSPVKDAVAKSNLYQPFKANAGSQLRKAALDIAKKIDETINSHFGELGIDLAMDTTGRIWLLEVNSKPSKNDNTALNEQKIRPSVKQMIEYSSYLSGF
ncbi:YheC/YheD family protein [Paenibacillus sediminis]|uniref:Glutathione synthase/RimK-type ligase-like ATP-grasp enzyme n=1 Tax=Paenibacillus sediminis TaxID=664909 RepID=A0ABS4H6F9_9BACL|nr:YheC/YheD family protein [Paenibacillus sediminis]MBP1937822.1 glutathione synthase/RimK-type ligase-like ATP-grasp enzyme [Paenibacillus sediminis]